MSCQALQWLFFILFLNILNNFRWYFKVNTICLSYSFQILLRWPSLIRMHTQHSHTLGARQPYSAFLVLNLMVLISGPRLHANCPHQLQLLNFIVEPFAILYSSLGIYCVNAISHPTHHPRTSLPEPLPTSGQSQITGLQASEGWPIISFPSDLQQLPRSTLWMPPCL